MEGDLQARIGGRLREHRADLHLSQRKFAERLGYGRAYVGSIERGERNLSLQSAQRLANRLGVDLLDLLGRGPNPLLVANGRVTGSATSPTHVPTNPVGDGLRQHDQMREHYRPEDDMQKQLGRRLRDHRMRLGCTQEGLAERLEFHLTYVSEIERGRRNLSLKSVEDLADRLGVDPLDLLAKDY